jgi:hypothetical protein
VKSPTRKLLTYCKVVDENNIFALISDLKGSITRYKFPVLAHLSLTPQITGGIFTCAVSYSEDNYFAPVSEDLYINANGCPGVLFYNTKIINVDDIYSGISVLSDYCAMDEGRDISYRACPSVDAEFLYKADDKTLTIIMPDTKPGDYVLGDLRISNVYIESAKLEKFDLQGIKIVLKLTGYAKYYSVLNEEVLVPDRPASEWLEIDAATGKTAKYSVDTQCFYSNFKIVFSSGNYEASGEEMSITDANNSDYDLIAKQTEYTDPLKWKSYWDSINVVYTPINLITNDSLYVKFVRFVQGNNYTKLYW